MEGTKLHGDAIRIVCISDTHNDDCSADLPDGDILIHAGDMTDDGTMEELEKAYRWISKLPHKFKVIVAGEFSLINSVYSHTRRLFVSCQQACKKNVLNYEERQP